VNVFNRLRNHGRRCQLMLHESTITTKSSQFFLLPSVCVYITVIFSSAGYAIHISWYQMLSVCMCVWMLTRVAQIITEIGDTCDHPCIDLLINSDHTPKTGSVWTTSLIKIISGKKWAWIRILKAAELHS